MKRKRAAAASVSCRGVFREIEHSPGREADDAAILEASGRRLQEAGPEYLVDYLRPASITGRERDLPTLAFAMCEGPEALAALREWERRGVRVINSPGSVENTHRVRMIPLLEAQRVPMPESRVLDCDGTLPRGTEEDRLFSACWIKQATEHKTREGDVVFAAGRTAVEEALERLRGREQPHAIAQRHVEGDVLKFYGISAAEGAGPGDAAAALSWFEWFHPKEHPVKGHPFDARALSDLACRAASALGLDIWGGDAIVTPAGGIFLIDVNAWPSFALYREDAATRIAAHLASRLRRLARVAV